MPISPSSSSPTRGGPGRVRYVGAGAPGRREVWIERDGVRQVAETPTDDAPARFDWSRPGPGACALARLVLQDATGSPALADRYCRALTYDVIARLPDRAFELSGADVLAWLERT
jgi:hypothetical protein